MLGVKEKDKKEVHNDHTVLSKLLLHVLVSNAVFA